MTTTGARTRQVAPRPWTASIVARTTSDPGFTGPAGWTAGSPRGDQHGRDDRTLPDQLSDGTAGEPLLLHEAHGDRAEQREGHGPEHERSTHPGGDPDAHTGDHRHGDRIEAGRGRRTSSPPQPATAAGTSRRSARDRATGSLPVPSHADMGGELGVRLRSDPVDLLQFLDAGEPAVLGPPGEDPLGRDRADSGQGVEIGDRGRVQVDDAHGGATRLGVGAAASLAGRGAGHRTGVVRTSPPG